ncbi:MAG: phosphatidate cytidylyltransferase [Treponema sp.]|nr:phosphatidate cytidylyltransferase [Treponema sp.]
MNKLIQRLLIFFIGVPVVISLVWVHFCNYLILHLVLAGVSFLSCAELYEIFSKTMSMQPKEFVLTVSTIPCLTGLFLTLTKAPYSFVSMTPLICFLIILAYEVFFRRTFERANQRIVSAVFISFYGGYLFTFITRITDLEYPSHLISSFLLMVFMCDSIAWLFGVLLGKSNKGFVAASPNKSIAGFIGGYVGSIAAALLVRHIWPQVFPYSQTKSILLGFIIATAAIIGDLAESVFKRAAGLKDSGVIIPGRGGILDSLDSILYAAPVFYILINL